MRSPKRIIDKAVSLMRYVEHSTSKGLSKEAIRELVHLVEIFKPVSSRYFLDAMQVGAEEERFSQLYVQGLISDEDYAVGSNRIIVEILRILGEMKEDLPELLEVEYSIAIAETGKAINRLLAITRGTSVYPSVLLLSFRYQKLEKERGNINLKEIEEIQSIIFKTEKRIEKNEK